MGKRPFYARTSLCPSHLRALCQCCPRAACHHGERHASIDILPLDLLVMISTFLPGLKGHSSLCLSVDECPEHVLAQLSERLLGPHKSDLILLDYVLDTDALLKCKMPAGPPCHLIDTLLLLCGIAACRACQFDTSSGGCCLALGSCTANSDCEQLAGNIFAGIGLNTVPSNTGLECAQGVCYVYTPSTSCNAVGLDAESCAVDSCGSLTTSSPTPVRWRYYLRTLSSHGLLRRESGLHNKHDHHA